MDLLPICKSLLRNRISFLLLAVQVAITLAVLVNALALVNRSREIINEPTGLDAENIITLLSVPFAQQFTDSAYREARLRDDLALLNSQPGVVAATTSNSAPGDFGSNWMIQAASQDPNSHSAGYFAADENFLAALGLELLEGRGFRQEEVFFSDWPVADPNLPQVIIITDALARQLFGEESALHKTTHVADLPKTVVGVIKLFGGRNPLMGNPQFQMLTPGYVSGSQVQPAFMIRVEPGLADRLMPELEQKLLELNDGRDIKNVRLLTETLSEATGMYSYGGLVLLIISGLLILTTALGIYGLASFSVTKRVKQIGTRRALGATRAAIVRYFLVENLITTGAGIMAGLVLAMGLNLVMSQLGLGRVDIAVAIMGILFVILVGQISVLIPALTAARISPAEATRTV
jgi:putative ABC transport system permease protein